MKLFSRLALLAPALSFGFALSAPASATDLTPTQQVAVTSIGGSKSSSNGFLLFTASVAVSGCEAGFWLPASDPAYQVALAAVKSALGKRSQVLVSGDRDQLWSGSTDHYCRVSQLQAAG